MSRISEPAEQRQCVHQVFRSGRIREFKHMLPLWVDAGFLDYGMGNCLECHTDGHNGRCPSYRPVTLHVLDVTEEYVSENEVEKYGEPVLV